MTGLEGIEMWRRLGIALVAIATLTACTATPIETPSPSTSVSDSPTPNPTPTVRGGTGPLGVVQVNQTLYDAASGVRVTISEATTAKLAGATVTPRLARGFPQVFALRVVVDTTESAARNIQVDFSSENGDTFFSLYSLDLRGDADCWTLASRLIAGEKGDPTQALTAIGGDVAFEFNAATHYGEGWVACPIVKTDNNDYMDGYIVRFNGASGPGPDGKRVGIPQTFVVVVEP